MKGKDETMRVSGDYLVDGKYSIRDLVDLEKLRDLFEKFGQATGYTIGFLDHPGMNVLIATGWRDICTKFHRGCPGSLENCAKSNRHLLDQLDRPGKLVIEECENGLVDCATPIIIKGKHIASLATGQLLLRQPDIGRFKAQAKKFGYDEREYLEALKEVRVVSEESLRMVTAFLGDIAIMISEMGYTTLMVKEDTERLEEEVAERAVVEQDLRDMSRLHTAMLNSMYQFIGLTTPDGTLIETNKAALDFIGCRSSEVLNKPFWETPWWRHSEEVRGLVRESCERAAKGEFVRFETTAAGSGNSIASIDFSVKPVRDEHGKVIYLIPEGRDITSQKDAGKAIALFARLMEFTDHGIYRYDYENGTILFANKGFVNILDLGCEPSEVFGKRIKDLLIYTEKPGMVRNAIEQTGEIRNYEYHFKTLKGDDRWVLHNSYAMRDPRTGRQVVEAIVRDITERKRSDEESRATTELLALANTSKNAANLIKDAIGFFQRESGCEAIGIRIKQGDDYPYYETRGFSKEFVRLENKLCASDRQGNPILDSTGDPLLECMCGNVINGRFDPSKPFFTEKGSFWTNSTTDLLATTTDADRQTRTRNRCNGQGFESVALIALSIGEKRLGLIQLNDRRRGCFTSERIALWERLSDYLAVTLAKFEAEEELQQNEGFLSFAIDAGEFGIWRLDTTTGRAWRSLRHDQIFGYKELLPEWTYQMFLNHVLPQDRKEVEDKFGKALSTHAEWEFECRIRRVDGAVRWIWAQGKPGLYGKDEAMILAGLVRDITERKQAEEELEKYRGQLEELVKTRTAELTRSNKDLEQFAYISSHDLQEPLRMVASYLQLIEKRYKNRLDKDADEFIEFAVDGAKRMQQLISDLLEYSRVTTRGEVPEMVSCDNILDKALANLRMVIEDSRAVIIRDSLPEVKGDRTQLLQLFQNLIGNALKFHGDGPPRVRISCKRENGEQVFSVADNGIGIDPQYVESIFVIFRRLHGRDEYPGTGIGLAICRKVVERHGGRIWVESKPGEGSTFYFTIPA